MASVGPELEWAARLSVQLQTLSELAENLTFRVLELEERLSAQDHQLLSLQMASDELTDGITSAMEERMVETEDRLVRIEGLLQGGGNGSFPARSLRALPKPSPANLNDPFGMEDSLPEEAAFLEEPHGDPEEIEGQDEEGFMEDPPFLEDLHDECRAS
ncbi:MAG: hypothetical protein VKL58_07225 [Cyanobacteriota bacterium]|jgi:hypothetical protein|nr:hypothetical protein [Cyanobacteriota bacterium]